MRAPGPPFPSDLRIPRHAVLDFDPPWIHPVQALFFYVQGQVRPLHELQRECACDLSKSRHRYGPTEPSAGGGASPNWQWHQFDIEFSKQWDGEVVEDVIDERVRPAPRPEQLFATYGLVEEWLTGLREDRTKFGEGIGIIYRALADGELRALARNVNATSLEPRAVLGAEWLCCGGWAVSWGTATLHPPMYAEGIGWVTDRSAVLMDIVLNARDLENLRAKHLGKYDVPLRSQPRVKGLRELNARSEKLMERLLKEYVADRAIGRAPKLLRDELYQALRELALQQMGDFHLADKTWQRLWNTHKTREMERPGRRPLIKE